MKRDQLFMLQYPSCDRSREDFEEKMYFNNQQKTVLNVLRLYVIADVSPEQGLQRSRSFD